MGKRDCDRDVVVVVVALAAGGVYSSAAVVDVGAAAAAAADGVVLSVECTQSLHEGRCRGEERE